MLTTKRIPEVRAETKTISDYGYTPEEMSHEIKYLNCLLNPFGEGGFIPDTVLIPRVLKDQRYSKTMNGYPTYLFKITGHNKDVQIRVYIPTGTPATDVYPSDWMLLTTIDADEELSDSYSADRSVAFGCAIRSGTQPVGVFQLSGTIDAVYTRIAPDTRFITTSNISTYRQDASSVMTAGLLGDGVTVIFDPSEDNRFTPTDTKIMRTTSDACYHKLYTLGVTPNDHTTTSPTDPAFKFPNSDGTFFHTHCSRNGEGDLPYPLEGRTRIKAYGQFPAATDFTTSASAYPLIYCYVVTEDNSYQQFLASVNCRHITTANTSLRTTKEFLITKKKKPLDDYSDSDDSDGKEVKVRAGLGTNPTQDYIVWTWELDTYVDTVAPIISIVLTGSSPNNGINQYFHTYYTPTRVSVQLENDQIFGTGYNDPCSLVMLTGVDEKQDLIIKGCRWSEAVPNPDLLKNLKVGYPRGLNITDLDHIRNALCRYEEAGYGRIWSSVDYAKFQLSSTIKMLTRRSTMVGAALDWRTSARRALGWLGEHFVRPALKAGVSGVMGALPSLGSQFLSGLNDVNFGYAATDKIMKLTRYSIPMRKKIYTEILRSQGIATNDLVRSKALLVDSAYDFLKGASIFSVSTRNRKKIDFILAEHTNEPVREMRKLKLNAILHLCSQHKLGDKVAKYLCLHGYDANFKTKIRVGYAMEEVGEELDPSPLEIQPQIEMKYVNKIKHWVKYLSPATVNSILQPALKKIEPAPVNVLPFRAQKYIYISGGVAHTTYICISTDPFSHHYDQKNNQFYPGAKVEYLMRPGNKEHFVDAMLSDKSGVESMFHLFDYFSFDRVYVTSLSSTIIEGTSYLMAAWAACYGVPMGPHYSGSIEYIGNEGIRFSPVEGVALKKDHVLEMKSILIVCEKPGEETNHTEALVASRAIMNPEVLKHRVFSVKTASTILNLMYLIFQSKLTEDEVKSVRGFIIANQPNLTGELKNRVEQFLAGTIVKPAEISGLAGAIRGALNPKNAPNTVIVGADFKYSTNLGPDLYKFTGDQVIAIADYVRTKGIVYPETYAKRLPDDSVPVNMVGFIINQAFQNHRGWFDQQFKPEASDKKEAQIRSSEAKALKKAQNIARHEQLMAQQKQAAEEKAKLDRKIKEANIARALEIAGTGKHAAKSRRRREKVKAKKRELLRGLVKEGLGTEVEEEEKEHKVRSKPIDVSEPKTGVVTIPAPGYTSIED